MRARILFLLLFAAALLRADPARAADEIHWTFSGPAAVTFDWRGADSTIRYGSTPAYGIERAGATPSPLPVSSAGPFREARLTGLDPAIVYHYAIGQGADHAFHAAPAAGTPFEIAVEGDLGDSLSYPDLAPVQGVIAIEAPDFVLVVGDLTYADDHGQAAVDRHFDDVMVWSQDAAYMPAWGNHDWNAPMDDLRNYKGRFELPNPQTSSDAPAIDCCGEDWYWFDYGSVRFIGYPEPYTPTTWLDWQPRAARLMDEAEADSNLRYIVTFGHRPAYSSGHHPGEEPLTDVLDALGDGHAKYVLSLNGHSHDYERSRPQHGVTFVTVGTGGSTLEEETGSCPWLGGCPPPSYSAFRAFHHGALRLRFTDAAIEGSMICGAAAAGDDIACTIGSPFDSFVVRPGGGGSRSAAARLSVDEIFPNPARSLPIVVYSLADDSPATIELMDVAGRRVVSHDLGAPGPGRHEIDLSPVHAPREGVYWLRLCQADASAQSKLVILR